MGPGAFRAMAYGAKTRRAFIFSLQSAQFRFGMARKYGIRKSKLMLPMQKQYFRAVEWN